MMKKLFISESPKLETVVDGSSTNWAVITHPHPLYGGDMNNNVVMAAWHAALNAGYSVLRFNFRGTGASEGVHDDGIGEIDDLKAAIDYIGVKPLLIGYSFGAWVTARLLKNTDFDAVLISPPNLMFEFPDLKRKNITVLAGEKDEFCDIEQLRPLMPENSITSFPVEHFWFGREALLKSALQEILKVPTI